MPVPTTEANNESDTEDLLSSGHAAVSNRFEGMMNMPIDISSCLQATEEGIQEVRQQHARMHAEPLYHLC